MGRAPMPNPSFMRCLQNAPGSPPPHYRIPSLNAEPSSNDRQQFSFSLKAAISRTRHADTRCASWPTVSHRHARAYLRTRQRVWADAIAAVFRAAAQLCEVGRYSPIDLGNRVGVVPERCRTASAVAKTCGGFPQVEAASEQLAGGVASIGMGQPSMTPRFAVSACLVAAAVWHHGKGTDARTGWELSRLNRECTTAPDAPNAAIAAAP